MRISYKYATQPVRDQPLEVTFTILNIGESEFGAKIDYLRLEMPRVITSAEKIPEIPRLKPSDPFTITHTFLPKENGLAWFAAKISSTETPSEAVEHYQASYLFGTEWKDAIYVASPEDVETLSLLREIANFLKEHK